MEYQPELSLERRCPCGRNPEQNPSQSDYVRTIGGSTIAFCYAECARAFEDRHTVLQLKVIAAGEIC